MSEARRLETLISEKPASRAHCSTRISWAGLAKACNRHTAMDSTPLCRKPAKSARAACSSGARSTCPWASSRSSISTTHSNNGSGFLMARSNSRGRSWLAINRTSAKPRVVTNAVRAPRRVSRAFVPRVVPSRTATGRIASSSRKPRMVRIANSGDSSFAANSKLDPASIDSGSSAAVVNAPVRASNAATRLVKIGWP